MSELTVKFCALGERQISLWEKQQFLHELHYGELHILKLKRTGEIP